MNVQREIEEWCWTMMIKEQMIMLCTKASTDAGESCPTEDEQTVC